MVQCADSPAAPARDAGLPRGRAPARKGKRGESKKEKKKPQQCVPSPAGILWGAKAIGAEIGKGPRQVFYLLESGKYQHSELAGNGSPPSRRSAYGWPVTPTLIRAGSRRP